MNTFDSDYDERDDVQLAPVVSSQVQHYQGEQRRIAAKITMISLQLRPGATDAQKMLDEVQTHVDSLTAFVGQQSMLIEAALTMQKQSQHEIATLIQEREELQRQVVDSVEVGRAMGYEEALDDMGDPFLDQDDGTEFTREEIDALAIADQLHSAQERIQELDREIVAERAKSEAYGGLIQQWEAYAASLEQGQKVG